MPGIQSPIGINSTITPTDAFTGKAEQNNEPDIAIWCYSDDQDGTVDIDFSVNGSDWFPFPTGSFKVRAGIPEFHTAVKLPRYVRVRWASSTAPTNFFLFTYYGEYRQANAPLNQPLDREADAIAVRPTDHQDEIAIGLRSGAFRYVKFGYRDDVDQADNDAFVIADDTTNAPTILTAASTYTVTYTSTADGANTGAGATGALTLLFDHLDENGERELITHTLGTDGSDETSFTGLGINRVLVTSTTSSAQNVADITITATTGGSVQAFVPAGDGVTQQLLFHVPTNASAVMKRLKLNGYKLAAGTAPVFVFKGWLYNRTTGVTLEWFKEGLDTDVATRLVEEPETPFAGGSVIWFTADTDTDNSSVAGRFVMNVYLNN